MSTFQNQLIQLAHDLKHSHHKDPKHHLNSLAFQKMVNKVQNITLEIFDVPLKFPQEFTQGNVYSEHNIRISLFFVPKGKKLPIHDHPKMFVVCKVLKGKLIYNEYKLQNKNYQIVAPKKYFESLRQKTHFEFPLLEASKTTKIIQQGCLNYITPDANLHSLQAIQDSIFLDVICPDYDQVQIFLNIYQQTKKIGKQNVILKMHPPKQSCAKIIPIGFN